jgi:hypothetical protein
MTNLPSSHFGELLSAPAAVDVTKKAMQQGLRTDMIFGLDGVISAGTSYR